MISNLWLKSSTGSVDVCLKCQMEFKCIIVDFLIEAHNRLRYADILFQFFQCIPYIVPVYVHSL